MNKDKSEKAKALNESLVSKSLPPEVRIKILIESLGITKLTELCQNDPELLDLCTIYKNTICKETLNEWNIKYNPTEINACELFRRIMYIIMSEINMIHDFSPDAHDVIWNDFLDTSDLIKRNKTFFEWAAKWNDNVVLELLLNYNNVSLDDSSFQESLLESVCRRDNLEILQYLIEKGIRDKKTLSKAFPTIILHSRMKTLDFLLSLGVGDVDELLQIAMRYDVLKVFLYLSFFHNANVRNNTDDLQSPKIIRELLSIIRRSSIDPFN